MKKMKKYLAFVVVVLVLVTVGCGSSSSNSSNSKDTSKSKSEASASKSEEVNTKEEVEAESSTSAETEDAEVEEEVVADSEEEEEAVASPYIPNSEDIVSYTFDDGVEYNIHLEGKDVAYDVTDQRVEDIYYKLLKCLIEKYFYVAKCKMNGVAVTYEIETVDLSGDENDYIKSGIFIQTRSYFEWNLDSRLIMTFSDGTTLAMYYEDDVVKVGIMSEGEIEEIVAFEEEDKIETSKLIDLLFYSTRMVLDDSFEP